MFWCFQIDFSSSSGAWARTFAPSIIFGPPSTLEERGQSHQRRMEWGTAAGARRAGIFKAWINQTSGFVARFCPPLAPLAQTRRGHFAS